MVKWIKEHKWLTGGLVVGLFVLYLVVRRLASGGGSTSIQQAAINPTSTDTSAQDAQNAQIQAQLSALDKQLAGALAAKQIDAQVATHNVDTQLAGLKDTNAATTSQTGIVAGANVEVTRLNTTAAVGIAGLETGRDITVAGIQKDIKFEEFRTALLSQLDVDRTKLAMEGLDTTRDVDVTTLLTNRDIQVAGIGANRDINLANILSTRDITLGGQGVELAQIDATKSISLANILASMNITLGQQQVNIADTNANRDIQVAGIGADVYHDLFTTQRYGITTAADLANRQLDIQKSNDTNFWNSIFANDRWGSGSNQVAALGIIQGFPSVVPSTQAATVPVQTSSSAGSIFGSIANIFKSIGPGLVS
jgi:hypothetical protein